MRSDRRLAAAPRLGATALALAVAAGLAAGCAPKDAPVCQPAFTLLTPAYGCATGPAPAPLVVEPPPPLVVEPPPPVAPVLATLGTATIDLAERLQFATGKPDLLVESAHVLDQVATILFEHPEITKVRIEGHTDSQGSNAANMKLSQARAEAVRTYLTNHGVAPDRMVAKGFGETQPIAANTTPEGREQNRRVVIAILDRAAPPAPPPTPTPATPTPTPTPTPKP